MNESIVGTDPKLVLITLKYFTRNKKSLDGYKFLKQIHAQGYNISCIFLTELLHGLYLEKRTDECWKIWYEDMHQFKIIPDHIFLSKLINIAKITNDCEKGINIWNHMETTMGIIDDVIL